MSPWGPSLQANFYCKSQQRATVCEIIKEAVCNNKKFQILSGHLPPAADSNHDGDVIIWILNGCIPYIF